MSRNLNSQTSLENLREKLIKISQRYLGRPYKYGAKISDFPKYFDCSGFVMYVYRKIGINLPRSTIWQASDKRGKKIKEIKHCQKGDLIFIRGKRGYYTPQYPKGIGHVGIYFGNNKVIHASSRRIKNSTFPQEIVEVGKVEIVPLKRFKKRKITVIKRFIY